jgi:hypothetical protein
LHWKRRPARGVAFFDLEAYSDRSLEDALFAVYVAKRVSAGSSPRGQGNRNGCCFGCGYAKLLRRSFSRICALSMLRKFRNPKLSTIGKGHLHYADSIPIPRGSMLEPYEFGK